MERLVKFSLVSKIYAIGLGVWKHSYAFSEWAKSHEDDDLVSYEKFNDLEIFREPNNNWPAAFALYRDNQAFHNYVPDKRTILLLTEDIDLQGWNKQVLRPFKRIASGLPQLSKINKFKQDDPTGWIALMESTAPEALMNHVVKACEEAIKEGTFFCESDENGIRNLIIWSIKEDYYEGHFLWSRSYDAGLLSKLWNIHRHYEASGIKRFYAFCRQDNTPSWKIHSLLGYAPSSDDIYLYSKG